MALLVLENCKFFFGGLDMSGDLNALSLDMSSGMADFTTFGSTTKVNGLGLKEVKFSHQGLWNSDVGASDSSIFAALSATATPTLMCPESASAGDLGYALNAATGQYSPAGKIGEAFAFTVSGASGDEDGVIRGTILFNGTAIVTGSGASQNLGAVSATQKLYASLHVLSASGTTPSLTVRVQSAGDAVFTTPVTRITFTAATAVSSQWATPVAGAIAGPWYRVDYTITGTTPSFDFVVFIGIQ